MSTLVNLLLATVFSILGGEYHEQQQEEEKEKSAKVEIIHCEEKTDSIAYYYNIADDLKFRSNEI